MAEEIEIPENIREAITRVARRLQAGNEAMLFRDVIKEHPDDSLSVTLEEGVGRVGPYTATDPHPSLTFESTSPLTEIVNRMTEIRAGQTFEPGSTIMIHPQTWNAILRDHIEPENVRHPQTLVIGGYEYPVIISQAMPPGQLIVAQLHAGFQRQSVEEAFGGLVSMLEYRAEEAKAQIEAAADSMSLVARTIKYFIAAWEKIRPRLTEAEAVLGYYDRKEIGYLYDDPMDWEPQPGSDLAEQLDFIHAESGGPITMYVEFQDHRQYTDGYYHFRRVADARQNRLWAVSRFRWRGPAYARISLDLFESLGFASCFRPEPGFEFPLGPHIVKMIRYDDPSMSFAIKRIDSRWSRALFWLEFYYNEIERRLQRARYRR